MSRERDLHYLEQAYIMAGKSEDLSTQLGAVLVGVEGYTAAWNQIPDGVTSTPDRLERPAKYAFTEHAERGAIYRAAREGISTDGATLYCPWFACDSCARAIICAGIARVVGHQKVFDGTPDRWAESIADAWVMFEEAGIETELIKGDLGLEPIRFNGVLFYP